MLKNTKPISSEVHCIKLGVERLIWKDVLGFEGIYKVSEYGDILNIKRGTLRSIKANSTHGYKQVDLYKEGKPTWKRVNRIVAEAFLGEPKDKNLVVMHLDNDKCNNHYTNLKWGTISENTKQAFEDGLEKSPLSKPCILTNGKNEIEFESISQLKLYIGIGKYAINTCIEKGTPIKKGKYKNWNIKLK